MMKPRTTIYEGRLSAPCLGAGALVLLVAMALVAPAAHAQEVELVTDRPDQTESTAIVPWGYVQLETGWVFSRNVESGTRVGAHSIAGILLRVGVVSRLEARVGFAGWNRLNVPAAGATTGAGDIDLGFKYQILEGRGRRPEIAVLTRVVLPTGASSFRTERVEPSVRLAVAHQLTGRVAVGYNLEATLSPQSGVPSTVASFFYSVAVGVTLTERLGAFVESFGTLEPSTATQSAHSVDGGFTFGVLPLLQLDVSGGVGLSDAADDWFVSAGMAILVGG